MQESQIYELKMIVTSQMNFASTQYTFEGHLSVSQMTLASQEISSSAVIWSNCKRSYCIELKY